MTSKHQPPKRYAVHGGEIVAVKYGTRSKDARTGEISPVLEGSIEVKPTATEPDHADQNP